MLSVRLLGELTVEVDGRTVELPGTWRARSLLAWLALNPGRHPRASVAARFWPEILDSSARSSLRNALWALRRALGGAADCIEATRERLALAQSPAVFVDAREFERLAAEGRLEEAVALHRGELLADLHDDWVYEARDAHRDRLSRVLERLAAAAEDAGDLGAAIGWSRRRAALDDLAEDAHRALIRRLIAGGRRSEAATTYGRLRERLRTELAISPSAATRGLIEGLRGDEPQAVRSPRAAPRAEPPGRWRPGRPWPLPRRVRRSRGRFVGRREQLDLLRHLLQDVRAGSGPRLALLTGEAGIGKTRLATEAAIAARGDGAVVLQGSCAEEALLPHQPFVEALDHYIDVSSSEELRARIGPRAADLAPLAPAVERRVPSVPGRGTDAGESRRWLMFEAAASFLAELAAVAPVVLLIDDVHLADDSTSALLKHVLETRPGTPLLVIATHRSEDAAPGSAIAEALRRLEREGALVRVPLRGLGREDVAELVDEAAGPRATAELAAEVHAETEGNPFFVREVLRHLLESERPPGARTPILPDSVREVIDRRVARLGDRSVRLLTVAAVIGREFELSPLERVSEVPPDGLVEALDAAVRAGLLTEFDDGGERFAFCHPLLRRALAARLTRTHRRRVHARIAEALEQLGEVDDVRLGQIAHHLCEAAGAGEPAKAVDYAARAAERAMARYAYAEAVDLYTRGLSLLPADDQRRRGLGLRRALAYQALTHQYETRAPRREAHEGAPRRGG